MEPRSRVLHRQTSPNERRERELQVETLSVARAWLPRGSRRKGRTASSARGVPTGPWTIKEARTVA
jgi:hypothetical protein